MHKLRLKGLKKRDLKYVVRVQNQIIKRQRGELNVLRNGIPQRPIQSPTQHRSCLEGRPIQRDWCSYPGN